MNIQKEIEEIKRLITLIQDKAKSELGDFELFLDVSSPPEPEALIIKFNVGKNYETLGFINRDGKCYFLSGVYHQRAWELWKENGFKVAGQEPVEWHGLKWVINKKGKLCIVGKLFDYVYDFLYKTTYIDVTYDMDLLKKDSDNRIHLY